MIKLKVKVFQPGLKYVFSIKKYKQERRKSKIKMLGWEKELNGRRVIPNNGLGQVGVAEGTSYIVNIKWCKCIGKKV